MDALGAVSNRELPLLEKRIYSLPVSSRTIDCTRFCKHHFRLLHGIVDKLQPEKEKNDLLHKGLSSFESILLTISANTCSVRCILEYLHLI